MRSFGKKCKNRLSTGGFASEPRLPPEAGGSTPRLPHCYPRLVRSIVHKKLHVFCIGRARPGHHWGFMPE